MNDTERAIKQFKEWEKDRWRLGKSPSIPTLILARQVLEKQAPKNAMGKGSTKEVGYCPNCKSHLMYEPKTNYCRWCGQRLSWEVENE